ncbi:outer membrane beta-barrel family protein [Polaribacter porphyrae]|uniref:outer membrane beta-barrel family protein n=1 Tax=Polaribacter porphyrae TaxID=1137780 RepID=UPI001FD42463|nr:outer membrane beta-barrel family protein [Polaribacter porphyrae]
MDKTNTLSVDLDYTDDFHSFYNNTFYTNVTNNSDFIYTRNSFHDHKTVNYTLNYRRNFKNKNHYIEVDYQYSDNDNFLPAKDFEDAIFLFEEERINKNKLNALALDYALHLNDKLKLETGFAWNARNLESAYFLKNTQNQESLDTFIYDENLLGVYALSTLNFNKLNLQIGLRYESLKSKSENLTSLETTNLTFSNFFPSIHASYTPDENQTINIGFSRRISRPNFRHINPFQARNQYFEWIANPSLQPEFSNNLETNYQLNKGVFNFSTSFFYRYRADVIERLQEIDNNGVLKISFDNIGEKHSYGIEASVGY